MTLSQGGMQKVEDCLRLGRNQHVVQLTLQAKALGPGPEIVEVKLDIVIGNNRQFVIENAGPTRSLIERKQIFR